MKEKIMMVLTIMGYFHHFLLLTCVATAGSQVTYFDQYSEEGDGVGEDYSAPELTPVFTAKGQHFTVDVGGRVTFPCQVENQGGYMLMFKHIMPGGEHRTLYVGALPLRPTKRLTKNGNTFTLSGVRRSHAGTYVCRIETSPAIEVNHTLDVQYPATVRRLSPRVQRVVQGTSVTLECGGDGNPPAVITWTRQQGHLPSGNRLHEGHSITLTNADHDVEGTYICTASNGLGQPSSLEMLVEIQYPPDVSIEESLIHTGVGRYVELVCRVHGRPAPSVTWLKSGRTLTSSHYVASHDGLHRYSLTIKQVKEDDFGEYTCMAESTLGSTNSSLRLTGLPRVPLVTSSPAGREKTSYTLRWEAESHTPVIMYRLQHRKHKEGPVNNPSAGQWNIRLYSPNGPSGGPALAPLSSGPVQYMSHAITDLEPATDYEATVAVENKFGWSGDSEIFHFYTRKEVAVGQSVRGGGGSCHPLPPLATTLLASLTASLLLLAPVLPIL
ncbi:protein amalgam-like isoform X2 [Eriocheir sinensis]|uniref:protein amalgam-like isoform X2 n=1 Tax=Eriocheir sinensis TaxID=95602 RepID=UPI0021C62BF3|nr:protein amalgam-like isoform X2 [Eriocheir sinensis]